MSSCGQSLGVLGFGGVFSMRRRTVSSSGPWPSPPSKGIVFDSFPLSCICDSRLLLLMMDSHKLPVAEVYIDESSHTAHRYLVLGGIIAEISNARRASYAIGQSRLPELPSGVMKWTKVSRAKLPAYTRVINKFFEMQDGMLLDFHSLVVDTTKQNHTLYNKGSQEIGFNKEVYQLAMKFGRLYKRMLFHIYPDRRSTNQSTEDLRFMLNRGIKKHYGDTRDWPFRRLQFREPEDSQLLQLADVFSGSIAWHMNGHSAQPDASAAKTELGNYILEKAGIADVTRDTAMRGKFTIWHRQLRNASRGPRPIGRRL